METAGSYIQLIALGAVLIGISALIAWRTSSRKLVPVLLLWLLWPALLMAAVLLLGGIASPSQGSAASNMAFAIMLIGVFALVPWVLVVAIGYAIGFVLRRSRPPEAPAEATPPPASRPVVSAARVVTSPATAPSDQPGADARASKPLTHQTSPDGSIRIDIEPVEWASSQWVYTPRVTETADGRILCDLLGTDWQADTAFPRDRYVWLGLRRYRTPGYLFVEFDLDADRYRIAARSLDQPDEEGPLADISERLETWWQRASEIALAASAYAQPSYAGDEPRAFSGTPAPGPFAAWRTALVILIGSIVAIAGLTWLSMETGIGPPDVPTIIRVPSTR